MINWAMGEFYMMAGYLQFFFVTKLFGKDLWLVALAASLLIMFTLGMVVEARLLKPMFTSIGERREDYATIVTIALSVLLRSLMVALAGPYIYSVPDYFPNVTLAGLNISGNRLIAASVAGLALLKFFLLLKYTWIGLALRAVAQNRFSAQTTGVNVWSVDAYAFGIGVSLAALAGILLAPVFLVYPESGVVPTLKGFVIVVLGGLGSWLGSIVGGMLLGLSEAMGTALLLPKYREVYGFLLLIAVLILRPRGLFGKAVREV
jgi:branched-chain amino acid transport system permease protein